MSTETEKLKGIYEKPPGSGVWWIHYHIRGQRHREKAGRRGDAIKLYQKRKADGLRGAKLPELTPQAIVRFSDLSAMALAYAETHLKTSCDYQAKALTLSKPLGSRPAADITPSEIEKALSVHCQTNGTFNKFRSFVSRPPARTPRQ